MLNQDYQLLPNGVKIFRGAVISLVPIPSGATKRKIAKEYVDTEIGENTVVYPGAVIYASVKIGKNCLICSNTVIREGCTIGDNCIIANGVTLNYGVTMGNNVKVMDNSHITGEMIIEDNVFISTLVATTNDNTMGKAKGHTCNPPTIRQGAVIGAGASILPGITIGKNAIVASGSVVTHNVLPNTRVIGIPARIDKIIKTEWKGGEK